MTKIKRHIGRTIRKRRPITSIAAKAWGLSDAKLKQLGYMYDHLRCMYAPYIIHQWSSLEFVNDDGAVIWRW